MLVTSRNFGLESPLRVPCSNQCPLPSAHLCPSPRYHHHLHLRILAQHHHLCNPTQRHRLYLVTSHNHHHTHLRILALPAYPQPQRPLPSAHRCHSPSSFEHFRMLAFTPNVTDNEAARFDTSPLSRSIPPPIPSLSFPRSIPPPQLSITTTSFHSSPPPLLRLFYYLPLRAQTSQYSLPTAVTADPRSPSNSLNSLFNSREQRLTGSDDHLLAITITSTSASSLNITTSACWLSTSKSAHLSSPHHAQPRLHLYELSTITTTFFSLISTISKPITSVTTSSNINTSATPLNVSRHQLHLITAYLHLYHQQRDDHRLLAPNHHHHIHLRILAQHHHLRMLAFTPGLYAKLKTLPITKPRDLM
ncbi:hypothetical protein CVT24_005866 [Panaeolus cyanescens]|uniref:Uncharacterized protein n=1 Tax=Panaeolus cyanescens TaxID=181874 RepID=A0A409YF09_9AGAR|nr:hypothetical protein CVT24_005866 [Panaeolus cyanescens]